MGRSPCCDETGLKKGPWTLEEDQKLVDHIQKHGHGSWRALPKLAASGIQILHRSTVIDRSARLQAEAVQATELQHLLQSAAAPQGGSPAPSSIDNNLEFNSDIAHRDDEYLLLLLLLQSELQNPSRYDHHQPALSNHEASQMISSSCLASLPRSRTLVSLPPLTDHHVSVANLSGDACSTSSCGGSPGTSSFVWPDLLLDDPFMNEFA